MRECFVIQPFDNDKFDKRYIDTFSEAIKKAGLKPYRVDKDLSVVIPIEDIHDKIKKADVVFCEISLDNPNVWYELGFAMASSKDIILVCSDERTNDFPFDIRHRAIITYKTQATSDFLKLENDITEKLVALLDKRTTLQEFESSTSIVKEREGLSEAERFCLAIILANQFTDIESVGIYTVRQEMEKEGYTDLATSMALRKLKTKKFLEFQKHVDFYDNEYHVTKITEDGEAWMFEHESEFALKLELNFKFEDEQALENEDDDSLPF